MPDLEQQNCDQLDDECVSICRSVETVKGVLCSASFDDYSAAFIIRATVPAEPGALEYKLDIKLCEVLNALPSNKRRCPTCGANGGGK